MNPTKTPRFALWLILVLLAVILALVSAELLARALPGKWTSAFLLRYDADVGIWHPENVTADYIQQDFAVRGISINSFGMRDRERSIAKEPGVTRIAVLGDSMTEGAVVGNEETYTRQLEELLGGKAEVLNFGVAGFGTAHEYAAYIHKVRQFNPDIVVLGFFTANDMRNNSKELETLYNGTVPIVAPYLLPDTNGVWELQSVPPAASVTSGVGAFLKRHSALYRFLRYEKEYLGGLLAAPLPPEANVQEGETIGAYLTRLYADPTSQEPVFQEAWGATDELIRMLRDAVETDGAKLVIAILPSAFEVMPQIRGVLEEQYRSPLLAQFDIDYPRQHLGALAQAEGISFIDLVPAFRNYRDQQNLSYPYFSYEHDGHWSLLGHWLAATELAKYLDEETLIP